MQLIRSLSGRLLLLTIVFVMLAEVLIFAPSVAIFRRDYLQERLDKAQIASLALLATPDSMVADELEAELLATAGVKSIVLQRDSVRMLVLASDMPAAIDADFDLRGAGWWTLIHDVAGLLTAPPGRVIRVVGLPREGGGEAVEAVMSEDPLRAAVLEFGLRVLFLSLLISLSTAALLVLAVRRFVVRPMQAVIDNMRAFHETPEDASAVIRPQSSIAEIRAAEEALAEMETGLNAALRQKARLAALGEALAKVSHDLRNVLGTAQLLADRLSGLDDPTTRRVGPKLLGALDRAIALCARTLDYGRAEEPAPEIRAVALQAMGEEVRDGVFPDADAGPRAAVRFENAAPDALACAADPEQLYRILANLARNARQAIESAGRSGCVTLSAWEDGARVVVEVADDGPGLPARALENLFTPFKGGARKGGAGLGLAIAQELAQAQGGELRLDRSGPDGAAFHLRLPTAPAVRAMPSRPARQGARG